MTTLSDSDVGKTVVDASGKELGMIASVEGNTAYVNPNPGFVGKLKAKLGMGGGSNDDYEVTEDMVDSVGDEVVLRGEI